MIIAANGRYFGDNMLVPKEFAEIIISIAREQSNTVQSCNFVQTSITIEEAQRLWNDLDKVLYESRHKNDQTQAYDSNGSN